MHQVKLPCAVAEGMIAHARAEAPNECCGVLAGDGETFTRLFRADNTAHSPVKFAFDPKEMLAVDAEATRAGLGILGFYHSHTFTEAYPSVTDVKQASWPEYAYLIVSLADEGNPVIRAFHLEDGQITEAVLEIG
ncbi:MAG: M67 family peptidase [Dehalococcoidia bacterium]|nr:M67 family peptidase [Dehalococcoidia bacterium]